MLLRSALHGDRFLTGQLVIGFLGGCELDDGARVLGTRLHSPIGQSCRPMKLAEQIR